MRGGLSPHVFFPFKHEEINMQANPIPGVIDTLKEANFDEAQRVAIIKAVTEMQQPILESIADIASKMEASIKDLRSDMDTSIKDLRSDMDTSIKDLRSDMDTRFEKLDTRLRHMAIAVYGLVIPVLFIVYQVAPTSG